MIANFEGLIDRAYAGFAKSLHYTQYIAPGIKKYR